MYLSTQHRVELIEQILVLPPNNLSHFNVLPYLFHISRFLLLRNKVQILVGTGVQPIEEQFGNILYKDMHDLFPSNPFH